MSSAALDIVEEFLRSDSTLERRNASTALAVLGTKESVARLIRMATADRDAGVRAHAEGEIAALEGEPAAEAARQLAAALQAPQTESAAYALLARVSASGGPAVALPAMGPWPTRLRRAAAFIWSSPFQMRSRLWLAWLPAVGVVGAAMVVLSYFALLTNVLPSGDEAAAVVLLSCLAAAAVSLLALTRSLPLAAHFDRPAAMVVELAVTGMAGAIVGAVAVMWMRVGGIESLELFAMFAVHAAVTAVATRLGGFLAAGRNYVIRALVGAAWGASATLIAGTLLRMFGDSVLIAGVFPLVIAAGGLAVASSRIDAAAPGGWPSAHARRVGVVVAAAFAASAVGWGAWMTGLEPVETVSAREPVVLTPASSGKTSQETIAFRSLPGWAQIDVKFPQSVRAALRSSHGFDMAMELRRLSDGNIVAAFDDPDPPRIEAALEQGAYLLIVGRYGAVNPPETARSGVPISETASPVRDMLSALSGRAQPFQVTVRLNTAGQEDPAAAARPSP